MIIKQDFSLKVRPHLNFIAFIKFLAMIYIIKWHIYHWRKIKIDMGGRMCEILFISSGFLVGYNYYQKYVPDSFTYSFKYIYKHFRTFYPLNLINILYGVYLYKKKLDRSHKEIVILNVLLLESWTRYVKKSILYHGVAWFLSALLFCYFLTPFLLKGITNIKNSIILFIIFAFIRIEIEEYITKGSINLLDVNFHRGPIIRCMEYYLGMLMIPMFFKLKKFLDGKKDKFMIKIIFTLIQINSPTIVYFFMYKYNFVLHRCYFVLIFCVFIFLIGYDYGYLSKIISHRFFKLIMGCQMEMYLFQITLNNIINRNMRFIIKKFLYYPEFIIKIIIIFIVAFIYKILFKQKLAKMLDFIFILIKSVFT